MARGFLGALVFTLAAPGFNVYQPAPPWIVGALILYLLVARLILYLIAGALILYLIVGALILYLIAGALILYVMAFVATIAVDAPLNNAIKAAGNPDQISNLAHVRRQFRETRWAAGTSSRRDVGSGVGLPGRALVPHSRASD